MRKPSWPSHTNDSSSGRDGISRFSFWHTPLVVGWVPISAKLPKPPWAQMPKRQVTCQMGFAQTVNKLTLRKRPFETHPDTWRKVDDVKRRRSAPLFVREMTLRSRLSGNRVLISAERRMTWSAVFNNQCVETLTEDSLLIFVKKVKKMCPFVEKIEYLQKTIRFMVIFHFR